MSKPKTLKAYFKILIQVADIDPDALKWYDGLSKEEQHLIWDLITGIQNDLGEMNDILGKFNLKWKG